MRSELVEFDSFNPPELRAYHVSGREITLAIRAEGMREILSPCDWSGASGEYDYIALARVHHDPKGELEPGQLMRLRAAENDFIGREDTTQFVVVKRKHG